MSQPLFHSIAGELAVGYINTIHIDPYEVCVMIASETQALFCALAGMISVSMVVRLCVAGGPPKQYG